MDDFPYLVAPTQPLPSRPPALAEHACPHAPDGTAAWTLRPRSRADLLRVAGTLRGRAEVRCLLLAPPERPAPGAPEPVQQLRWPTE